MILIQIEIDPPVAYSVRATDQDGTEVYNGPAPIWPLGLCALSLKDLAEGKFFAFEMTPHLRGTKEHAYIGRVNAARTGIN